jgi:hypothetical protein
MLRLCRVLALACGLLLALPPNWCCAVGIGQCCGPRPAASPCGKCSACPECGGESCCSSTKAPAAPAPPAEPPCKRGCCEWPPTVAVPKAETPTADPAPAAVAAPFAPAPGSVSGAVIAGRPAGPSPTPLHVLHCVWLC